MPFLIGNYFLGSSEGKCSIMKKNSMMIRKMEEDREKALKLSFRKGDWLAIMIVALLGITVALLFAEKTASSDPEIVQIFQDNQCIAEYSLSEDNTISVEGKYSNLIQISGGRVAIIKSNCPGEDCIHSGWIDSTGRSIVCLPNKVEIRVLGAQTDVDFVVR